MKNNRNIVTVMITIALILLVSCDNSTDEISAKSNNQSSTNSTTQNADGDVANKDVADTDENTTEKASGSTENNEQNNQEDISSGTSANVNDGQSNSSNSDNENKKKEYLQKLNKMEESDRYSEAGTTITELEEQEAERYKNWDEELNEIYGVLKEQLPAEQMDKLREEQRSWVKHRDEAAKEASLKYKGGTTESLEYVATQASLTRERCYTLVAKYMK
ncbi:lysozyme inhibitor LprI family protein [Virgibacillus oceani]|uniref:Lysozyme inhibitor LprI-like N-terminal domain-containing protein n=1 Tax=Virgibacillus oceani TaxID=1479511 RepID=A0A917HJD5_9BACI|nr:lysozyme inhibitor LprI family protein [Virgibacillus oceani]GGG81264.1 hypothetical protein GCM10011398_28340 [Virgibacillus oceani]